MILLCRNKSSTEFMLSVSDKRQYKKRLIFLVSVAEQAVYTTLLETPKTDFLALQNVHTGKCIRRFGGIYAYCRYSIDRKSSILVLILYRKTCHMPKGL